MIFHDYFNGEISSFLGMTNSEIFVSTNNEIGEIMNEIHRRPLITDSECYTKFNIAIITLIISTVYLTFKSFTLEYSAIKGSKEIIENLCVTV